MSDISLPSVPSGLPGVFVYLTFAGGTSGAPTGVQSACLVANCTTYPDGYGGTLFGPDTLVPCQSVNDAISLCGAGSPAHLMYQAFKQINTTTPLYIAPVQAATGGTQASQSVVVSVGAGQTAGVIQYSVDGGLVGKFPAQATFASTDTATTIAANLAAAINSNVNLPVTATASSGTLTITAKVAGLRGNDLRGFAQVVSGSGVTSSVASPANFTGGAGSDLSGVTATLNGLANTGRAFTYLVMEAGNDNNDGYTNQISAEVESFLASQALPSPGNRMRAISGSNDTMAHTTAVSTTLNYERMETVQCKNLDLTPGEMAAHWAGAVMLTEADPLTASCINFDGFGNRGSDNLQFLAPLDGSAPSASDVQTAVVSGVTALQKIPGNKMSVVKRCTTRYFTLGGASGTTQVLDLRITDSGVVTICDRLFDSVQAVLAERWARTVIGQDPSSGAPPPAPGVVTPDLLTDSINEVIDQFDAANLINGTATKSGLVVQQQVSNPSAFGITLPVVVNALAHQFLVQGIQLPPVVV